MTTATQNTEPTTASAPSEEIDTAGLIDGVAAEKNAEAVQFENEYAFTTADLDYRNFTADARAARSMMTFPELRNEYSHLWAEMAIRRAKLPEVDALVGRIVGRKDTYQAVERLTRGPLVRDRDNPQSRGGRRLQPPPAQW
jgi:hypothetical protein